MACRQQTPSLNAAAGNDASNLSSSKELPPRHRLQTWITVKEDAINSGEDIPLHGELVDGPHVEKF